MAGFTFALTLALTEDQAMPPQLLQKFCTDVIRPAASAWDEREQTPWRAARRPSIP